MENLDGLRGGAALWRDVVRAGQTLAREDAGVLGTAKKARKRSR